MKLLAPFLMLSMLSSCVIEPKEDEVPSHVLTSETKAFSVDSLINAAIEIPAGTIAKWEFNKDNLTLEIEEVDGQPRQVNYLGYPGNYGMIPGTILPKELGGDGDPLDVLVLGSPIEQGYVVQCRPIGVLQLLDHEEQDDKIIAVNPESAFGDITTIEALDSTYTGVLGIIETWFENYKGPGKMESKGYASHEEAKQLIKTASKAYRKSK